jgi:hypothetical protein
LSLSCQAQSFSSLLLPYKHLSQHNTSQARVGELQRTTYTRVYSTATHNLISATDQLVTQQAVQQGLQRSTSRRQCRQLSVGSVCSTSNYFEFTDEHLTVNLANKPQGFQNFLAIKYLVRSSVLQWRNQ